MKNIVVTAFALMSMGIFFTINPAFAGDRVKAYEMAESGITIEFPMTPEEIAAEDAENDRRAAIRKSKSVEQKKQVVIFELAESGVIIEFPVETSGKFVLEDIAEKNSPDDSKL